MVVTDGIGNTTLARKVYDSEVVKRHFNYRVWITVCQPYNMEKLLKVITKKIGIDVESNKRETYTIQELINSLREYLKTQRYVIVFYDISNTDFWEVMKHALPKNDKGSRIIVTTCNDKVAATCQETSCDFVHKLQPLSKKMAWELFCKKTLKRLYVLPLRRWAILIFHNYRKSVKIKS